MKKTLDRIWAALARAVGVFPLTPLGLFVVALSALAGVRYGWREVDLVLLVVGLVGAGLGVVTMLVSGATALWLWLKLRRLPEGGTVKGECGYPVRTGFSIRSLWFIPMVRVRWQWVSPEAAVNTVALNGRLVEEVTPMRRGMHDTVLRRFEVSDAFGLTRVVFTVREPRGVRFMPSVGNLKNMHVVRSISGGDNIAHPAGPPEGERVDLRNYAQGDPIKFVLWKVYARSRQLVVRTPERAIAPVKQTVAYVVSGRGDEPAAGAARVAVDSGALGSEWVLGADGNDVVAKNPAQALEVLARSAHTEEPAWGAGLTRFLDSATPGKAARAVVFVPATRGPWLDRVVAAARSRGASNQPLSPVEFVVCTDGIAAPEKGGWWRRLAYQPEAEKAGPDAPPVATRGEVAEVVSALAAARARVLVVDRRAGKVYSEGHHRAWEAEGSR
ncbi:MAG: DUF58 domain-containing protein [Myxococcales bacterium]|nr:DUF58 domain-containing protein [Myxococcales bacterium]